MYSGERSENVLYGLPLYVALGVARGDARAARRPLQARDVLAGARDALLLVRDLLDEPFDVLAAPRGAAGAADGPVDVVLAGPGLDVAHDGRVRRLGNTTTSAKKNEM